MTTAQLHRLRILLCNLQDHIRDTLLAAREKKASSFANIAAVTAADTIYAVDKISEEAIFEWFSTHWPKSAPVEIVMEGVEDGEPVTFPRGTPVKNTILKCILDPIDGTRNLMYDKRSAWILGALAPQRGAKNHLGDILIGAMTELPTSKQWRSDQFSAIRGSGVVKAEAVNVLDGSRKAFKARPSQAKDFKHGFASLARFFPEGKALCAQVEERLWEDLHGLESTASPLVFDDQYISTGGQIYELLVGHDRMIGDIRPLLFDKIGLRSSLTCHPYDICTAFLLVEAGGIVETPQGRPLRAPLDTTSRVAWMGYGNPTLAKLARPILKRAFKELLQP